MCCNCSLWEPGDKDKDAVLEKDLLCKIYVCICVCNGVKNHGDDRGGGSSATVSLPSPRFFFIQCLIVRAKAF